MALPYGINTFATSIENLVGTGSVMSNQLIHVAGKIFVCIVLKFSKTVLGLFQVSLQALVVLLDKARHLQPGQKRCDKYDESQILCNFAQTSVSARGLDIFQR